ncbi:MAG: helix-turn-helix domain-containing protein [Gaiellales bacterium]
MVGWFGGRDEYCRFVVGGVGDASLESRPSLAALVSTRDSKLIALAHRTHGYRLAEIADHLGIGLSTVWREVRRGESA